MYHDEASKIEYTVDYCRYMPELHLLIRQKKKLVGDKCSKEGLVSNGAAFKEIIITELEMNDKDKSTNLQATIGK